jgi:hypothetical protein
MIFHTQWLHCAGTSIGGQQNLICPGNATTSNQGMQVMVTCPHQMLANRSTISWIKLDDPTFLQLSNEYGSGKSSSDNTGTTLAPASPENSGLTSPTLSTAITNEVCLMLTFPSSKIHLYYPIMFNDPLQVCHSL